MCFSGQRGEREGGVKRVNLEKGKGKVGEVWRVGSRMRKNEQESTMTSCIKLKKNEEEEEEKEEEGVGEEG